MKLIQKRHNRSLPGSLLSSMGFGNETDSLYLLTGGDGMMGGSGFGMGEWGMRTDKPNPMQKMMMQARLA